MSILCFNGDSFALTHRQMILRKQCSPHPILILLLVRLCAKRMNSRALAHIQHAALQHGIVNCKPHLTAQSIHFPDQMPFRRSTNGRIACHQRHTVKIQGQKQCIQSHPRAGQGCFTSSMPAADDDNVCHPLIPPIRRIIT